LSHLSAIMFDFSDSSSAAMARELLLELGYDPVMHHERRMHIHVEGGDLTSALEIAQAHGGQLVEQAHIAEEAVTSSAYALDAITIPAHVVNEDWIDAEGARNRDEDGVTTSEELLPDDGTYNHFSGDVHI
jgi:hypothetical protein